jgi:hypothetical protein
MISGYYHNWKELTGLRMAHVIDITVERWFGIALNNTVDRIL